MPFKETDKASHCPRKQHHRFFINLAFLTFSLACAPSWANTLPSSRGDGKPNLVTTTVATAANMNSQRTSLERDEASLEGMFTLLAGRGVASNPSTVPVKDPLDLRERGINLVISALGLVGIPYRWGGNTEETGFDCSGFVSALYSRSVGLLLPRKAEDQAAATKAIKNDDLQPGDLVFFNTMRRSFSHVGIYVGDGRFIHSPRAGASVRVDNMQSAYWLERFNGARRVPVNQAVD